MNDSILLRKIKRLGTATAFMLYPLLAGFAFASHPNLLQPQLSHDIQSKIQGFHHNSLLHLGHVCMTLGVPLLIIIAIHLMDTLQPKAAWWGFTGGVLAVAGSVVLALDKAALCLVPSAFDTLTEVQFQAMLPGIEAMFQYRGWLWLLWLLPLLPLGFILQSIGLVRSRAIPRIYSIPMLLGSILMANPDIDIIGLIATVMLAAGFIPYAIYLLKQPLPSKKPAPYWEMDSSSMPSA